MAKETENIAIKAINKFFYFSLNYESGQIYILHGDIRQVPKFITRIKWGCPTDHMVEKWCALAEQLKSGDIDSFGVINRFYAGLDNDCRVKFLNWILDNYKGEGQLKIGEE